VNVRPAEAASIFPASPTIVGESNKIAQRHFNLKGAENPQITCVAVSE